MTELERRGDERAAERRGPRLKSIYASGMRIGRLTVLDRVDGMHRVQCDCGAVVMLAGHALTAKARASVRGLARCSLKCAASKQADRAPVRLSKILNRVRVSARSRARPIEMSLTLADVEKLRAPGVPCHYCGGPIADDCGGLDRVDSRRGYAAGNVVPCCAMCNTAKGHLLTYNEFRAALAVRRERLGPAAALW